MAARPGLDGGGGFAGQHEEARLRSPTRGKRPHYAHRGPAKEVGVDQSEDRDARDRFRANGGEQRIAGGRKGDDRRDFKDQASRGKR